jgi:hypothetical protein
VICANKENLPLAQVRMSADGIDTWYMQ